MSRLAFDQVYRAPTPERPRWSLLRFAMWTVLLCAMVFWSTLIILA